MSIVKKVIKRLIESVGDSNTNEHEFHISQTFFNEFEYLKKEISIFWVNITGLHFYCRILELFLNLGLIVQECQYVNKNLKIVN